MKRVKMIVAYDGTNYCGWQIQKNGITIEEVLNRELTNLLKEPVTVIGASRTDSGVHSEGNVAVFDTENRMPADKICFALNQRLPDDIRILQSEEVAPDYHPRKQNCVKTYEYKIMNRKIEVPTMRLYSYFCYFPLDVERMREGGAYLVGEHDFKSFCANRKMKKSTVRVLKRIEFEQQGSRLLIRFTGNGFLYNMVRILTGTLIEVGLGQRKAEEMKEILNAKDRNEAGYTAPPEGLFLEQVCYKE